MAEPSENPSGKRVVGRPFQKGGDPRIARGHGKGGRPKDEWKAALRELASADEVLDAVRAILQDHSHPQFLRALEYASERGYGKEAQGVEGDVRLTIVRRDESGSGAQ